MSFANAGQVQQAVANMLSPKNGPGQFVIIGYSDDNTLVLQHQGSGTQPGQ